MKHGQFTPKEVAAKMKALGMDLVNVDKVTQALEEERKTGAQMRKDAMPAEGRPMYDGRFYDEGPFSVLDEEVIAIYTSGGSPLMRWIPTATMEGREERVAHLEWIAAKGYTSDMDYGEYLHGLSIGECGYGPSTAWSGFAYSMPAGSFSFTTTMMKAFEDGGIQYFKDFPRKAIRHLSDGSVEPIANDNEWAMARVLYVMESHVDYILRYGDMRNSPMEWDGLEQIIKPGYVQSHIYNSGVATWADPVWINGIAITDAGKLLQAIRFVIRLLMRRATDRNWPIEAGDMAVVMPAAMWDNIAEGIAAGAAWKYTNSFGFDGQMNIDVFERRYREVKSGGLGFGKITVDNFEIPVIPDGNMGNATTLTLAGPTTKNAVTGDVYILTRAINGFTVLEQQYLDWTELDYPNWDETLIPLQGGIVRSGRVTESNKCYYWFGEMVGRMVSLMQPMQGIITGATIPMLDYAGENEAAQSWAIDYYARAGLDNPL